MVSEIQTRSRPPRGPNGHRLVQRLALHDMRRGLGASINHRVAVSQPGSCRGLHSQIRLGYARLDRDRRHPARIVARGVTLDRGSHVDFALFVV